MDYKQRLMNHIGKKVYIRKRSNPSYIIVGVLVEVDKTMLFVTSGGDEYFIDYEDILTMDIKNQPYHK